MRGCEDCAKTGPRCSLARRVGGASVSVSVRTSVREPSVCGRGARAWARQSGQAGEKSLGCEGRGVRRREGSEAQGGE